MAKANGMKSTSLRKASVCCETALVINLQANRYIDSFFLHGFIDAICAVDMFVYLRLVLNAVFRVKV